ncbi:hypothetical protein THAR02_08180 [Trichoderma harzianum]|uniref:Uncharacterized protein n=1 Tax=Trichoderma harzianum TaxID=5544 RepID=A0A0F9XGK2_TRIHA|nr:hypothetical protein THAR02_08180 [Trichoderma harzianum]
MFFTACLLGLLTLPAVRADGWDDFSNNLATDLAPFLSLFGEQITKQYLSESIATIDYFIFAMAPMGILTAIVSAIRVAQEGGGVAEAELCSSTSRDVCELYNNGGIARVFGRPKILEVVYDPDHNFADEKAESPDNKEPITDAFAQNSSPNLSLNVGIKRKPPAVFWAIALLGIVLQTGVLVFAVFVTYYLHWEKDETRPESYACPLTIAGTVLLCGGIFLCAFLVGESTKEQVFRRNQGDKDKQSPREILYWVQPGGQVLGDQVFDAFCCSDHGEPLQEYITSWKNQVKIPQIMVWAAVGISVTGFVMQFVGLRAIHSAVSVAQLGATMLMSAARAALRQSFGPVNSLRLLWRFRGTPGNTHGIAASLPSTFSELNVAAKLLTYRTRLAQLTQSHNTQILGANSAKYFDIGMVEVREKADRLALAIESAVNAIFSKSFKIGVEWRDALSMYWGFACDVAIMESSDISEDRSIRDTIYLRLTRENLTTPWKLQNTLELEGLLGLWVWSLKSDPAVEVSDLQSHFTISRATEIPRQRIVSTNKNIETDLKIWLGDRIPMINGYELDPTSVQRGDPSITKWKLSDEQGKEIRLFGWHVMEASQSSNPNPSIVMSAHTDSSLLSLCAQEVFGSFVSCILNILEDIGDMDIQETPSFHLENILVAEMVKLFTEAQLGPNEDALICILPLMIPRLKLSSTENAVVAAQRMATKHRRAGKWTQAETMLRWAWAVCNEAQPKGRKDECQNDQPLHADEHIQQAAIALGELYRWLSDQNSSRQEPGSLAIDEIINRYHDIAERVMQQGNDTSDSRPFSEIKDDLNEFLFYITLAQQMTNEDKGKALCSAAKHGWTEMVLSLLELGAEPDFKDPAQDSRTALSQTAGSGSINTMKELIDWGAFPNTQDKYRRTPLSHASEMGHTSAVQVLLGDQRVDPDIKNGAGSTPLSWAAENGHEAVVKLLIESGRVDINAQDTFGNTPLALAAKYGHATVVLLLAQSGSDLNSVSSPGYTALTHAAENGHAAIVLLLAEKGADVNVKTIEEENTPLLVATSSGHATVAEVLVQKGADLDAKKYFGMDGTN